jgi:hypothetical protein
VDSNREINDELPLGVDSVVRLLRAPVEIRVATDVDDLPYLEGEIAVFRFRSIASGEGRRGVSTRKARLRRPRDPSDDTFGDEAARGYVRLWRDRSTGTGSGEGITLFVQGLTPEAEYEVWIEDDLGDLVDVSRPPRGRASSS